MNPSFDNNWRIRWKKSSLHSLLIKGDTQIFLLDKKVLKTVVLETFVFFVRESPSNIVYIVSRKWEFFILFYLKIFINQQTSLYCVEPEILHLDAYCYSILPRVNMKVSVITKSPKKPRGLTLRGRVVSNYFRLH